MKKYILPICVIISLAFSSCYKGVKCCTGPSRSEAITDYNFSKENHITSVSFNDHGWAGILTDTIKNDTVVIYGRRDNDLLKLKFHWVSDKPYTSYTYNQNQFEATYYTSYDRLSVIKYTLDSTATNSLLVMRSEAVDLVNTGTPWLSGSFKLTFKVSTAAGKAVTDTSRVYFTSGNFDMRLQN